MEIGSTPSPGASDRRSSALSDFSGDFEAFLQLLTAQVANQDPLAPMDSSTYVTQLAQLSQVEQTVAANETLGAILATLSSGSSFGAVNLIGRSVQVADAPFLSHGDATPLAVRLGDGATDAVLSIEDSAGRAVRSIGLAADGARSRSISWDGLDDGGAAAGAGPFRAVLRAPDGSAIGDGSRVLVPATVDAFVSTPEGGALVLDSGAEVAPDRIARVE